jgi:hypothetical protein
MCFECMECAPKPIAKNLAKSQPSCAVLCMVQIFVRMEATDNDRIVTSNLDLVDLDVFPIPRA